MRTTLTVNQIVDEWYRNTDVLKISKDSYRKKLAYWFRWLSAEGADVRSARRVDVLNYKQKLQLTLRESSVDSYLKAVKSFYNYCEERRYCDNIAVGIKMSRRRYTHAKRALTRAEAQQLIHSVGTATERGLRDKIIISLMICNGLRSVEVERLTIADWLPSRIILIKRKGRLDKQPMRISNEIYLMIEEYLSCRSSCEPTEPLLMNHSYTHHGMIIHRQSISKMVKARLRHIGIDSDKVTSHSLRHTCAQLLFESNVKIEEIQIILGHTNITTTKIYMDDAQELKLVQNSPCVTLSRELLNSPQNTLEINQPPVYR